MHQVTLHWPHDSHMTCHLMLSVKHEQLLEGLIAAEQKESEEEEAALTALASKIFEEKRANLRRLTDEPDEVIRGCGLVLLCIIPEATGSPTH